MLSIVGVTGHAWTLGLFLSMVVVTSQVARSVAGDIPVAAVLVVVLAGLLFIAAVRVRVEPAGGVRLPRNLAPALHDEIESLLGPLRAPRFEAVLLGTRMDVGTVRVARLGGLRGFDNYLVIGLPLLLALPLDHVRALIARELAHYSRGNTVRGARVYRLREGWLHAARAASESRNPLASAIAPFQRWFARRYAAISLDVVHDHEFAADRRAAQVTSRDSLAGALLRLQIVERFLSERFHPGVLADLRQYGTPPTGLCRRFENAIDAARDDPRFNAWVDAALHRDVTARATRPPLRRRLSALAVSDPHRGGPRPLVDIAFADEFTGMSAARLCLAAIPEAVLVSVEKAWVDDMQDELSERHQQLVQMDERRRQLESRVDLSPAEMLEHAIATAETDGADSAIPILRMLTDHHPDMAPARFVLGTLLLQANDAEGLSHIHAAVRLDATLDGPGRDIAAAFLRASDPGVLDNPAGLNTPKHENAALRS